MQYNDHTEKEKNGKGGIYMAMMVVYIPREHYHVNGSYCTVKPLLLQMIAAGLQRGRHVS